MKNRDKYNRDMDMKIMEEKLLQAVNSGIKKCEEEERSLKMKKIKMGSIAAALVVFVGLGGCLLSPTFADTKIGKSIFSYFDAKDNIQKAADLKYGGDIIASTTWEGKIMNITYGMRDQKGIVLFFELINEDGTPAVVDPDNIMVFITAMQDEEHRRRDDYSLGHISMDSEVYMEEENKGYVKIMNFDSGVDYSKLEKTLIISGEFIGIDHDKPEWGQMYWFKFDSVEIDLDKIGCEEIAETVIDKSFDIVDAEVKIESCQLGPVTSRVKILTKFKEENKNNWFMPSVTVEDQNGNVLESGVLLSHAIEVEDAGEDSTYTDLYKHSMIGLENSFLDSEQELTLKKLSVEYSETPGWLFVDINKGELRNFCDNDEKFESPFYEMYDFIEKDDVYEFRIRCKGEEDVPLNENITVYTNTGSYTNIYGFKGAEIILDNDQEYDEFNFGKVYKNYGSALIRLDKSQLEEINSRGVICVLFKPVRKVCEVEMDIKLNSYK